MDMVDYVISVRNRRGEGFGSEPGPTRFLEVPAGELPAIRHRVPRRDWILHVLEAAKPGAVPKAPDPAGDLLVFVHGYNNDQEIVLWRHRKLQDALAAVGYRGAVVSFDWPSNDKALNYLEDRSDAKKTALRLVDDCIRLFSTAQLRGCAVNVHLLAHSTGAYVIREAFDDADDRAKIASVNWTVSQICLIGADVSRKSMRAGDAKSSSIYRHSVRVTNYQNPYDSVLKLSNIKRIGVAPRVGRVGLPADVPEKAVNVDCGDHFAALDPEAADYRGAFDHAWHIGDPLFTEDLLLTLQGDIDRDSIPTRHRDDKGRLSLGRS